MTEQRDYAALIRIDRNQLDDELIRQPEIFAWLSEDLVTAIAIQDEKKNRVPVIEAELNQKIRKQLDRAGEKYTEAVINSRVLTHEDRTQALNEYTQARANAGRLMGLKEAFSQRANMLRELAHLFAAGYWSEQSAKGSDKDVRDGRYARDKSTIQRAMRSRKDADR